MAEEALLGGFECRASGRLGLTVQRAAVAGDVGGLHGGVEVVMDDGEGPGIGIVDAGLLGGEPMLDQLVLDAIVGERAGRVERSDEHTSELQSLMRISYAVFCLKKQKNYEK